MSTSQSNGLNNSIFKVLTSLFLTSATAPIIDNQPSEIVSSEEEPLSATLPLITLPSASSPSQRSQLHPQQAIHPEPKSINELSHRPQRNVPSPSVPLQRSRLRPRHRQPKSVNELSRRPPHASKSTYRRKRDQDGGSNIRRRKLKTMPLGWNTMTEFESFEGIDPPFSRNLLIHMNSAKRKICGRRLYLCKLPNGRA
jgi:hypothetical protein